MILLLLCFISFCAFVSYCIYLVMQAQQKRRQMLSVIGIDAEKSKSSAKNAAHKNYQDISKKLEEMNQDIKKQTLSVLIAQAGLKLSVKGFWVRSVLFALIFAAIFLYCVTYFILNKKLKSITSKK